MGNCCKSSEGSGRRTSSTDRDGSPRCDTMAAPGDENLPNGGWGWMVVLGVAISYMFNQSLGSVFGLLFGDQLMSMGHGTFGAALVMNMNCVTLNFTGLIAGPVLRKYSARSVSIVGSLLIAFGLMLSSITTNLTEIVITYGVVVGIGMGLMNPATFIAVHSYFTTRRGQAVGLAMAGTGIGQMLMPQVISVFLEWYGFRGSILIMGGLSLNGVAGAMLFQPVEWHMKSGHRQERTESLVVQDLNSNVVTLGSDRKESWLKRISKSIDLALFKDPLFCSLAIGLALVYAASISFSMIFPFFLQESAGLSRTDTALCMSVLAGADVLSRLTLPILTDKYHFSCRNIFLVGAAMLCFVRELMSFTTGRTALLVVSAAFGYIRAATVVNQNLVVSEYATKDQLAGALGLNMVVKGVAVITIGQLLGWVRDYSQSYQTAMHAQNVCLAVTIVWWSGEMLCRWCRPRSQP